MQTEKFDEESDESKDQSLHKTIAKKKKSDRVSCITEHDGSLKFADLVNT
jgi:hypothetical protein